MLTKQFEIRDRHTLVPALAICVSGTDGPVMRRAGFQSPMIYLIMLATQRCGYDPWQWHDRTMHTAHLYIVEQWEALADHAVIDVEFIRGETTAPKRSALPHDDVQPVTE